MPGEGGRARPAPDLAVTGQVLLGQPVSAGAEMAEGANEVSENQSAP